MSIFDAFSSNQQSFNPLNFGKSILGLGQPTNANTPGGVFGKAVQPQAASSGGFLSGLGKNLISLFTSQPQQQQQVNTKQPQQQQDNSLWGMAKQVAPGFLTSLAGNLFSPAPQLPDVSGVRQQLTDIAAGTNNPYRTGAANYLTTTMNADPNTPPSNAFTQGDIYSDEAYQKELKALTNQWKSIRPGADYSNDPTFQKQVADLGIKYRDRRVAERDALTASYSQQQQSQKLQSAINLLQLDKSQAEYLSQIAQLDYTTLMYQYGLSYLEAQNLKDIFLATGQGMIEKQLGLNSPKGGA